MNDETFHIKIMHLKGMLAGGQLPRWMEFAMGEIGQKEISGDEDNPRIVEYAKTTTLKASDDETSWCSSFANWCMKQGLIKGTGLANARSWLKWGYECDSNVIGSIVVMSRGSDPTKGHVGFLAGFDDDTVILLGGNQGDMVKYSRFSKSLVLGYRWPFMRVS